jgi:hypothetical protein
VEYLIWTAVALIVLRGFALAARHDCWRKLSGEYAITYLGVRIHFTTKMATNGAEAARSFRA